MLYLRNNYIHKTLLPNGTGMDSHMRTTRWPMDIVTGLWPRRPALAHRLVGWLLFNGTFSTKRLYCAMQKLKVCLHILSSDRK